MRYYLWQSTKYAVPELQDIPVFMSKQHGIRCIYVLHMQHMLEPALLSHRLALVRGDSAQPPPRAQCSSTDDGVSIYAYTIPHVQDTQITVLVTNHSNATVHVQQHCDPEHAADGACLNDTEVRPGEEVPLPLTFNVKYFDKQFDIREVTMASDKCCYHLLYVLRFVSGDERDVQLRTLLQGLLGFLSSTTTSPSRLHRAVRRVLRARRRKLPRPVAHISVIRNKTLRVHCS